MRSNYGTAVAFRSPNHPRYTRATMAISTPDIEALIHDFTARLMTAAHAQAGKSIRSVVAASLNGDKPVSAAPSRPVKSEPTVTASKRRKIKLTAKGLAARKLQGQYLGLLRGLKPGARARVKKIAREKGVAEALKFAGFLK